MRALLVLSYPPMTWVLQRGLQEEGFEVDRIQTPEDATIIARSGLHDVVVLDLMAHQQLLPVLSEWRQAGLQLPVLALTVNAGQISPAICEWGPLVILTKPFLWSQMSESLWELVRPQISSPTCLPMKEIS